MTKQTAAIVDDQAEWFNRNMLKIVRKVRNRLTAELNKFDRSGGNLESTPANIQRLNQIYGSIMTELQNAGYGDLVQQLQAKESELLKSIKSSRPEGTVPIAFTETSRDALAGFNSLFNQQFGGLAQSVARDIAGAVGNSIFGTQRVDTVMKEVARLLDDKFARYAATYVNTSRAQFIQAAEYESAKGYDGELYWIYEGPEDDITRPICRVGTGMDADGAYPNAPYFTESERLSFEAESAGLRMYNCRHSFMQISEEYYNENVGGGEEKRQQRADAEQEARERVARESIDFETRAAFNDLGITEKSTIDEVQKTFRAMAKILHPDKGGSDAQMRFIIEARDKAIAWLKTITGGNNAN